MDKAIFDDVLSLVCSSNQNTVIHKQKKSSCAFKYLAFKELLESLTAIENKGLWRSYRYVYRTISLRLSHQYWLIKLRLSH